MVVCALALMACNGDQTGDTRGDGDGPFPGLDSGTDGGSTSGGSTTEPADGASETTPGETETDADIVSIEIVPNAPMLEVLDGVLPPALQLQAIGTTAEGDQVPLEGQWDIDRLDVASVDTFSGELNASGLAGGVATVVFTGAAGVADTPVTVKLHITDDGGVDDSIKQMFEGAGQPDPTLTLLYPYDETVFPRDLAGPVVQWNGGTAADVYYVHLDSPTFEYEAWRVGLDPGRFEFPVAPTDVWKTLTASVVADDIGVELQRYDGTTAYQPVTSSWHIADADLIGTIYYWEVNNGSVVRLKVGDPAPEPFLESPPGVTCIACHSVSADGSTLVASFHGGYSPWGTFDAATGSSLFATDTTSGFQAISPEGDYVVWGQTSGVANLSTFDSIDVLASLPMSGGGFPAFPAWSPDGTKLAYTVRTDGNWLDFNNASLWVSDVDLVTPGFANDHQLVAATPARTAVTYPTWSPDSQWLAYGMATQARTREAQGELGLSNLDGSHQVGLDRACGVGSLAPDQSSACYEPTFMPESRGGYFWLVFVSERTYGNTLLDTAPTTRRKQLWITAIEDPPPPGGQDPSRPAFWLPGQETNNHNMRGAWTLEPPDIAG